MRQLAENLRVVVGPELPDAEFQLQVRGAMRSYARYWLEAFRLPSLTRQDRLDKFGSDRTDVLLGHAVPDSADRVFGAHNVAAARSHRHIRHDAIGIGAWL